MSHATPNRQTSTAHGARPIYYAPGANLSVSMAKTVGWRLTGSDTMLTEGLHSPADTRNQGLLLPGPRQAGKASSMRHPLGEGRAIFFWPFIVALMLFSTGGLLSIHAGVHRLQTPSERVSVWVAIAILLLAAIAKGLSLRTAIKDINKERRGRSFWICFHQPHRSGIERPI